MSAVQQLLLVLAVLGAPIALGVVLLLWPAYALCAAISKAHSEE